jgi:hypothetical protein
MTLVVYSKHDLKSLENLIAPHFRTLPNRELDSLSLERIPFSYLDCSSGKHIYGVLFQNIKASLIKI